MNAVLYDPEALLVEELPLDREPMMALVGAVLAWEDANGLRAGDCAQTALLLTGNARIVAEVSRHRAASCGRWPSRSSRRRSAACR
ncbi:hypothetical protein [Streptomyces sp. NPDC056921]|uniref:hypothetical protein n=1 Tax=Streptomyces sp. NPDC056921 TaxID=3345966 RepID=UPI0036409C4D